MSSTPSSPAPGHRPSPAMSPALPSPSPPASPAIPDREPPPDLPLTMTASAILTALPRDATAALAVANAALDAGPAPGAANTQKKIVVRFKPVGAAPALRQELCKVGAAQKFETVVAYLRRILRVGQADGLFLYVNSAFAPALDEVVGNLWTCFKDSNGQLIVAYSMTPAFG